MKKEKVIYIGGFELPDKNAAAQRVLANSKAIRDLDYEVVLIGLSKESEKSAYIYDDFKCYDLKYPMSFFQWIIYILSVGEVKKIIDKECPSKVIFYNYPAFKLFFLMKILRKKDCKIYADITEWYETKSISVSSFVKRIDVFLRMKVLHQRMDGLIVISNYLEKFYKSRTKNIINVPPLVDIRDQKWLPYNKIEEKEPFVLTYVGSPGDGNKDRIDIIIESVAKIKDELNVSVCLRIVGITESQFFESFNFDFKDNKERYSFVIFEGRVNHLQAINILKGSDYSIFFRLDNLTSRAGFPTKFVESISAGIPVITNFSSNLMEYYIKYPKIGFGIERLNEEEIYQALKQAFSLSKNECFKNKEDLRNSAIFDYKEYRNEFSLLFKG